MWHPDTYPELVYSAAAEQVRAIKHARLRTEALRARRAVRIARLRSWFIQARRVTQTAQTS